MILIICYDIFSKYVLIVPLKDKRGITIADVFQETLDKSNQTKQNMGRQR